MPLTEDRKTDRIVGPEFRRSFGVSAGDIIYRGALVALDATGYLVPGATATTLTAVGMSLDNVDNSGGADGDLNCTVSTAPAKFENSAGADEIMINDIGAICYIVDDETVALTDGAATRSEAGLVHQVESDGVWVRPTGF